MILLGIMAASQVLLTLLFLLVIFVFPLIALINVFMNRFPGNDKITWVIVIIFLPFFGSLLYFLIGRRRKLNQGK